MRDVMVLAWRSVVRRRVLILSAPVIILAACAFYLRSGPDPHPAVLVRITQPDGKGAAIGRIDLAPPAGGSRTIVEGFSEIGGLTASFDGRSLAFSGRRRDDEPLEVWEAPATGGTPRRFVSGECLDPAYLPDGRIAFVRPVAARGSPAEAPAALHVASRGGRDERRITFGDARDRSPVVIPDGRIAFRRSPLDGRGSGRIMALSPDGTGLGLLCGPAEGSTIEAGPWAAGDRVVFAESEASGERLVSISPKDPAGSREVLHTLDRLAETFKLRARGPRPADLGSPMLPASWKDGLTGFAIALPGPRPPVLTSVVDEKKSTGTLLCLDVYASRIPALAGTTRGSARAVRVLGGDGALIGEAPVEPDGSFFVTVPADEPLVLEVLGPEGPIGKDPTGIWVRPNENRGCIGCHEDPELSPRNRVPLAVGRDASTFPQGTALAGPSPRR